MKKRNVKIILIMIGILIGIILLDTLQARIFKHSPFISWKEELVDEDSWVDRGILMDTYYCTKDSDIVTVSWHFKTAKYTCPIDNVSIDKFVSYDFSVVVDGNSKYEKTFAFCHNGIDYYYGNTDFKLYLTENIYKYDLETSLTNNLIDFNDILNKSISVDSVYDGGSKLYRYNNFNIVVCNTIDGNNDVIVGDTELKIGNLCV